MPLLPGCRTLPVSRAGGAGRTQAPCGLAPIPSLGDPTCSVGYPGQRGHMSCQLQGGRISARSPRGTSCRKPSGGMNSPQRPELRFIWLEPLGHLSGSADLLSGDLILQSAMPLQPIHRLIIGIRSLSIPTCESKCSS